MLKPAILFKDELERKFKEQIYTNDFSFMLVMMDVHISQKSRWKIFHINMPSLTVIM